jgi:hypothetical protein
MILRAVKSWCRLTKLIQNRKADGAEMHWTKHLAAVSVNLEDESRPLAAEVLPRAGSPTTERG